MYNSNSGLDVVIDDFRRFKLDRCGAGLARLLSGPKSEMQ